MCGRFQQRSSNVVEAYEFFMLMAKKEKSHSNEESLVKLNMVVGAELILGKDKASILSQISLSNDTVKRRADELFDQDIKDQLLDQLKQSLFFAIQCDETTDIGKCSQLLLYAGFLSVNMTK